MIPHRVHISSVVPETHYFAGSLDCFACCKSSRVTEEREIPSLGEFETHSAINPTLGRAFRVHSYVCVPYLVDQDKND